MKINNKVLKKEAAKTHNKILEKNKSQFESFCAEKYANKKIESNNQSKKFFNSKLFIGLVTSLIMILVITITLLSYLPKDDGDDPMPKHYIAENEVTIDTTIQNIIDHLQGFLLELDEQNINNISMIYDSISNDLLYFRIGIDDQDNFLSAKLYIITNKEYSFNFYMSTELINEQFNGFEISFDEIITDEGGIFLIESKAQIFTTEETIFVEFSGYSIDETSNFLNWLGEIIKPN